jgi:chromosome segregation ATPase
MDAVIASTKDAQQHRLVSCNEDAVDSPLPADLETPGHSILLDRSHSDSEEVDMPTHKGLQYATESKASRPALNDLSTTSLTGSSEPVIDAELWCRAVTTALAFRAFKLGVTASRREKQEAEDAQHSIDQYVATAAAAEARAVRAETEMENLRLKLLSESTGYAVVATELSEAEAARDQALRRLSEETHSRSQLTDYETRTVALQRDVEEARNEITQVVSQREATAVEHSAEVSAVRAQLSTSESLAQQLTVQLEQMRSEVCEHHALLKQSGEQLRREQALRSDVAAQLQVAKDERASLEEETKRLASELAQLREDWFASWEAEQHMSSASAQSTRNIAGADSDSSSSSRGEDSSYLRYLKVEKDMPSLDATVDLSWWQPTAAEEKKRQGRRVSSVEKLKTEWEKAESAQQELHAMQKKVDTRRARLRDQLARHGIKATGDHAAPRRKYVDDDDGDDESLQ